jgi:hypothetical protein
MNGIPSSHHDQTYAMSLSQLWAANETQTYLYTIISYFAKPIAMTKFRLSCAANTMADLTTNIMR